MDRKTHSIYLHFFYLDIYVDMLASACACLVARALGFDMIHYVD